MKRESGQLFWVSYSDLMTALFILALALFVLSYKMFKIHQADLLRAEEELSLRSTELEDQRMALDAQQKALDAQRIAAREFKQRWSEEEIHVASLIAELEVERSRLSVMESEYKKLQEIQKAIEQLDARYFIYQPEYKRHVLHPQVQFAKGSSVIAPHYKKMLVGAGRALKEMVDRLDPDDNIKYLLVIEGMASADAYRRNYELSYERALSLFRLWEHEGISFDPNRYEIMISGSGEGGVGRDRREETNNQRFLIQIVPKIGELQAIQMS